MKKFFLLPLLVCLLLLTAAAQADTLDKTLFFDEDNIIISLASFHDELYLLTYEGIFQYDVQSGQPIFITDEVVGYYAAENCMDRLCATTDGLYAIRYDDQYMLRILDQDAALDLKSGIGYEKDDDAYILSCALTQHYFCLLEQIGIDIQLKWIERETGQQNQMKLSGGFCLYPYQNDSLLYATKKSNRGNTEYTVESIDLLSGNTTCLLKPDIPFQSLCSDQKDNIYLIGNNKVFHWNVNERELQEAVNIISGDIVESAAFANHMIAVIIDNSLAVRSTENNEDRTSLVLYEPAGRSANYQEYLEHHPEIELRFTGNSTVSAEEQFVQDMLTQTDTTDIYLLSDISALSSIAKKRMAVDLSLSSSIKQLVRDMYPAFAQIFCTDDHIWAMPSEIYIAVPGYNEDFFDLYGLPVPTSVMEMLELTEKWLYDFADEHPEACFDPFTNGLTLNTILRQYEIEKKLSSQSLSFEDGHLSKVISKYQTVCELYEETVSVHGAEFYAFNLLDLPHSAQYKPLLLSVQDGCDPVISNAYLEMKYLVINPYSNHIDEAMEFVESICAAWDATTKALLLQTYNHAIESPDYQRQRTTLSEKIQSIEMELQTSSIDDRDELKSKLASLKKELDIVQQNQWVITEKEIGFYQELTSHMFFQTNDPLDLLGEQILHYYAQLQSGKIDVIDFLRTIDNRIKMVLMEE